jgi:phage shock protein A
MAATGWDEVGDRFTELGRTLRDRWSQHREGDADAAHEVRDAVDGVKASLDDLAETITRTVNDPDVHQSARSAASGLIEALTTSLDQLTEKIQQRKDEDGRPGGGSGSAG